MNCLAQTAGERQPSSNGPFTPINLYSHFRPDMTFVLLEGEGILLLTASVHMMLNTLSRHPDPSSKGKRFSDPQVGDSKFNGDEVLAVHWRTLASINVC